jgi:hypothetical protein
MLVGLKGTEFNAACLSSPDGELHLQVESAIQGRILLNKPIIYLWLVLYFSAQILRVVNCLISRCIPGVVPDKNCEITVCTCNTATG